MELKQDIPRESDPMIDKHFVKEEILGSKTSGEPENENRKSVECQAPNSKNEHSSQTRWTYEPNQGFRRYKHALRTLDPIERKKKLDLMWRDELGRQGPEKASFGRVVWRAIRTRTLIEVVLFSVSVLSGFMSQMLLAGKLLEYVESTEQTWEEGLKWGSLLILAEMIRVFLFGWVCSMIYRTAIRFKLGCMMILYRKVIGLNHLTGTSTGQLINVFSNDCQRIFDMVYFTPFVTCAPVITLCGVWYILTTLGPMALVGIVIFLIYFVVQYRLSSLTGYIRSKAVKIADSRIRLMNEILDCMKLIKMYAWESHFSRMLQDIRKKEQRLIFATNLTRSLNAAFASTIPVVATIAAFLAHVLTGGTLTASKAFPVVTFFASQMLHTLMRARDGFLYLADSFVAFGRIKEILILEEDSCPISKPILKSQALAIKQGTFAYTAIPQQSGNKPGKNDGKGKNDETTAKDDMEKTQLNATPDIEKIEVLFNITFDVNKGQLIGICGQVGSGKSSLLMAALGQLRIIEGQVMRDGSCAYVSQQAWILNATLRENILFGNPFVAERYHQTLSICSLNQDLEMLPGGDLTEIGEKGINLSGGQKQRVALARALYADRDIYFLDDPLSAVDAHVGLHIFNKFIIEALRDKTVIFVTHQIQYLNRCDDIHLMRDGRIIERGTHDDLMKMNRQYASMVNAISEESSETASETIVDGQMMNHVQTKREKPITINGQSQIALESPQKHVKDDKNVVKQKASLTEAEQNEEGVVTFRTYLSYGSAACGWFAALLLVFLTVLNVASTNFSNWWLARWINAGGGNITDPQTNATISSNNINDNPHSSYYQTWYASSIAFMVVTNVLRTSMFCRANNRASTTVHKRLFEKIMTNPMRFFDTTPTGRIQNLFSRDMDEIDSRIPITMECIVMNSPLILTAIATVSFVFPWFILPMCVLMALNYFYGQMFRVASRDLKRIESSTRAPILSHITATVQGLSTIHAFEKDKDFETDFNNLLEKSSGFLFVLSVLSRWLALRLDGLTVVSTAVTVLLVLISKGHITPALAGLALNYTVYISGLLQYTIRMLSDAETQFISVERVNNYINHSETDGSNGKAIIEVLPEWPASGALRFEKVVMSYGKDTPIVLQEVSFAIEPREKIGIVGRTGSGKSSLTVALFRLVELAAGRITIDDVDISEVGLEQLRSRLSIIPQDPILFSGTIRSNLDPFKVHTDLELWDALEKTQLKERVQSIAGHLDTNVGFGGDNLSVGERQLLCLARALLRRAKILVLDEATAAVDPETEIAVQNTIQREFSDSTVLTIAHRLQTVVSCDRILVMDDGQVAEFDKPSTLLADENSRFAKMMEAAEKATQRQ